MFNQASGKDAKLRTRKVAKTQRTRSSTASSLGFGAETLVKKRERNQGASMTSKEGIHTQTNSFAIVAAPAELKKAIPMGDETIGRHGRKNRVGLNGAKKATPNVPSTIASRNACEAVAAKKEANSARRLIVPLPGFLKNKSTTSPLNAIAKKSECVSPRCPSIVV